MMMRALVIDDSKFSRTIIIKDLQRFGITDISEAANGLEAIQKIDSGSYELITLDLIMPGMNGIEVLKYIKQKDASTRVIVCSSSDCSEIDTEADSRVGCLKKPFTSDKFMRLLSSQLG